MPDCGNFITVVAFYGRERRAFHGHDYPCVVNAAAAIEEGLVTDFWEVHESTRRTEQACRVGTSCRTSIGEFGSYIVPECRKEHPVDKGATPRLILRNPSVQFGDARVGGILCIVVAPLPIPGFCLCGADQFLFCLADGRYLHPLSADD